MTPDRDRSQLPYGPKRVKRARVSNALAPYQRADELVAMGLAEFGELLPGEKKMLSAAAKGDIAYLATEPDDDRRLWFAPYKYEGQIGAWREWKEHRWVRADVLRWLCVLERAQALVDATGVCVEGAWIDGRLRLDGARIPFRVALVACACPAGISLMHTNLDALDISGSVLGEGGIDANGMKVSGGVHLRDGFISHGQANLVEANVGGDLDCTRGAFNNEGGNAIIAAGMNVSGNIYLSNGFVSHGQALLVGSIIGGILDCTRGTFSNEGGNAISADRMMVSGDVHLRDGFVSYGTVRLNGAGVGGDLVCRSGTFENEGGLALDLQGVKIEGALILRDEVSWNGEIDLTSAQTDYLLDEPGAYPDRLCLTDFRYRAIFNNDIGSLDDRLAWLKKSDTTCQDHGRFDPQPYRHLASVLRLQGHDRFSNEVMYRASKELARAELERLRESGSRGTLLIMRMWHAMLDGLVGHGYRRWLPIPWLLGFVLFGALVFSDFDPHNIWHAAEADPGAMQPTQGLVLKDAMKSERWIVDYPTFRPLAYSADTFLPLVNLHQESYWTPKDGIIKRLYLPLHIIAGWIVTTMAALSFTGLVRHERE